ncbi:MAG: alpha-amylase family glycosyl hydrolase [Candidatus Cryptobacteroides sp.]
MKFNHISLIFAIAGALMSVSCSEKKAEQAHPEWSYDAVIYEMNVRQYTPEGTLAAAAQHLPRLKELGVDVIWLMPIYPIGVKERKGTLGSYYAISDYCDVNPEFGELPDFDAFLAEAHKNGLKVILDWVANHTSPDAKWIDGKPLDWYERDSLGNTIVQYDWTDIAALNYDNEDMRHEMRESMRFWLKRGIDGFRCDMACEVPMDFWKSTIDSLRNEFGHIYMLAEGEEPKLHNAGFDASYSWELHHMLNAIAQGRSNADSLRNYLARNVENYGTDAFRLMFTSNHDENSWAGTEFERMGDAAEVMAALTFTLPQGQPLIYTGQEVGFDHRFLFFEKDPIAGWEENDYTAMYRELCKLRHTRPALRPGKEGTYEFLQADGVNDKVLAFKRMNAGDTLTFIANLSAGPVNVVVKSGDGEEIPCELNPWGYIMK